MIFSLWWESSLRISDTNLHQVIRSHKTELFGNLLIIGKSASYMKFKDVGNVLLEAPEKAAEAILLFCQGLGLVPNVLGARRTGISRGLSMIEADKPNISRLSR